MDLAFAALDEQFRREFAAWPDDQRPRARLAPPTTPDGLRQHLEWESNLHAAGCAASGWPKRFGGRGMDLWRVLVYDEEYVRRDLPERLNKMVLIHGARTVMAHGTEERQTAWLPGILDCTDIWCQGFSEPDAGTELAALRTTARVVGDELIINGQKTWTSNGAIATPDVRLGANGFRGAEAPRYQLSRLRLEPPRSGHPTHAAATRACGRRGWRPPARRAARDVEDPGFFVPGHPDGRPASHDS
jgi:alkylation response protein AidB-like acyl-CoA dehydrogenase